MKKLEALVSELELRIPDQHLLNEAVSKAAVGWHIEHALLTLNVIMNALKQYDPVHYNATFDIRRQVVMLVGIIPRGKVKAPAVVRPTETFNEPSLRQHLFTVRENMKSIESLSGGHYFTHPFLGDFKLKPAIKFMRLHTNHHLKIINDIIKNSQVV